MLVYNDYEKAQLLMTSMICQALESFDCDSLYEEIFEYQN